MMTIGTPLGLGVSQGRHWRCPRFSEAEWDIEARPSATEGLWEGTVLNGRLEGRGGVVVSGW